MKAMLSQPMAGKSEEEIKATSGVQMGWLASQADMLAEDWVFVE